MLCKCVSVTLRAADNHLCLGSFSSMPGGEWNLELSLTALLTLGPIFCNRFTSGQLHRESSLQRTAAEIVADTCLRQFSNGRTHRSSRDIEDRKLKRQEDRLKMGGRLRQIKKTTRGLDGVEGMPGKWWWCGLVKYQTEANANWNNATATNRLMGKGGKVTADYKYSLSYSWNCAK